jgi:predicted transcriptional regulator
MTISPLSFRTTPACKVALGKIADEKKVSIAWVIRDAITKYLSEEAKKYRGDPTDVLPLPLK